MDALSYLIIFCIFLIAEAFFSGSEIALIATNPRKIRKSPGMKPWRMGVTLKLLQNRERMLATTLGRRQRRLLTRHLQRGRTPTVARLRFLRYAVR